MNLLIILKITSLLELCLFNFRGLLLIIDVFFLYMVAFDSIGDCSTGLHKHVTDG